MLILIIFVIDEQHHIRPVS